MQTANLALFEIMTRYRPELFCCESMEDILHELRKRGYPANGIFEGSGQKLKRDADRRLAPRRLQPDSAERL